MRDKLRKITEDDYRIYGLSDGDFGYTVELARGFAHAKRTVYELEAERVRAESPDLADDILDDVAHYSWIDTQYIWHFCLWRLQGVFEGLIVGKFLPLNSNRRLIGLKAKLDAARAAGHSLTDQDYEDLLAWANLRNALSHMPPEQYSPGLLEEEDLLEYQTLLERVCGVWAEEHEQKQPRST